MKKLSIFSWEPLRKIAVKVGGLLPSGLLSVCLPPECTSHVVSLGRSMAFKPSPSNLLLIHFVLASGLSVRLLFSC